MTRDLWMVLLGSALAFGGGLVAFFIQTWWARRNQQKLICEFVKLVLGSFQRVVPRITEHFDRGGVLWIDLLDQVSNDFSVYERNREHSTAIQDEKIRIEIWDWFSSARTCVSKAHMAAQTRVREPENAWAIEEIPKQVTKLKELANESRILAEKLK